MAWSERLSGATWKQHLDNGTTASGAVATVSVNMGALNPSAWDVEKAGTILNALQLVLSKTIVKSIHTIENELDSD